MLKEYKEKKRHYDNFFLKYEDGDIFNLYRINHKRHGLYYYWSEKNKIYYDKGYFNMDKEYSHWIEYGKLLNYYL